MNRYIIFGIFKYFSYLCNIKIKQTNLKQGGNL
nr:MAG TPA: hypothetical protein [Bacteriophage sp.]